MGDLCTACMCNGRKLFYIGETGFYHLYTQILNEIQVYDSSLFYIRVCWECVAHLRKWLKFKELAKRSYTQLQYVQQNNFAQDPQPPHLSISPVHNFSVPEPPIKTESSAPSSPLGGDGGRLHEVKNEETHCEPETFVNGLDLQPKRRRKKDEKSVKEKSKKKIKPKSEKIPVKKKIKVKKKRSLHDENLDGMDLDIGDDADEKDKKIEEITFDKENNFAQDPQPPHLSISPVHNFSVPEPLIKTESSAPSSPLGGDGGRLHEVKNEETHCEPETFVNGLDLEPRRKRKKVEKSVKEKSKKKIKPKSEKIPVKKEIKVKKKRSPLHDENMDGMDLDIEDDADEKYKEIEDTADAEKHEEVPFVKESTRLNGEVKPVKQAPLKEVLPERPHCVECGKNFSSRKTYRYHLNVLHKGQNRYPCPRCGKVYQWKSNLGRHLRSHKARDSGELYCEMCDKRFASVATYRQHLRVSRRHVPESEFSFMCNECGKKFVNKTRLRDHIDWEHLKIIKFRCQLCNKPFKCHTSLYVHLQNVHRNKEKKDNLCHVCGKSYQNAAKLKYHIVAMHTSETPYQCQRCSAAFGWYSSLYRHVREVHYKLNLQPKKSKKSKKSDLLPSLLPNQVVLPNQMVLPPMHQPGPP